MIRTFHPVGQGAFYTEQFNNGFTIVYDCGSETNISFVENEIRNTFQKGDSIDAVFISHLHYDHINGLDFLLKYCKVKKIFLPLITLGNKILLQIENIILFGYNPYFENFLNSLMNEDNNNINNTTIIRIPVLENETNILDNDGIYIDDIQGNLLENTRKIRKNGLANWVFIPFNFRRTSRLSDLQARLQDLNIDINALNDINAFQGLWEDITTRNNIIDAYKSISGSLNTNTMTLYSGPEINRKINYFHNHLLHHSFHHFIFWKKEDLVGCLYFGDYEAKGKQKWQNLIKHYQKYWNIVGVVQIPHHGSKYNYNRAINNNNSKFSIISSGYNNKHRHPHSITLKDILNDSGIPIIVNEQVGSRAMFEILNI
ncbi:MAG: MBL fold metallo-hydrolase [Bacteroidales bacterium]|nr:MBL fold metallo-hydrolase [Bacteroidales bacterium]